MSHVFTPIPNAMMIEAIRSRNHGLLDDDNVEQLCDLVKWVFPEVPTRPVIELISPASAMRPVVRVLYLLTGFGYICTRQGMCDTDGPLHPDVLRESAMSVIDSVTRTKQLQVILSAYPCPEVDEAKYALTMYDRKVAYCIHKAYYNRDAYMEMILSLKEAMEEVKNKLLIALGTIEIMEYSVGMLKAFNGLVDAYMNNSHPFPKKDKLLGISGVDTGSFYADGFGGVETRSFEDAVDTVKKLANHMSSRG